VHDSSDEPPREIHFFIPFFLFFFDCIFNDIFVYRCMTAVMNLLEKFNIAPTDIGRLEVLLMCC
jgi:hypothetical protein